MIASLRDLVITDYCCLFKFNDMFSSSRQFSLTAAKTQCVEITVFVAAFMLYYNTISVSERICWAPHEYVLSCMHEYASHTSMHHMSAYDAKSG